MSSDHKKFLRALQQAPISPDGKRWLQTALNPFEHEEDFQLAGLPDKCRGKSSVMRICKSETYTSPGVGGQLHFAIMPAETLSGDLRYGNWVGDAGNLGVTADVGNSYVEVGAATSNYRPAFLTVCSAASGVNTFDPTAAGTYSTISVLPNIGSLSRRVRVIAAGAKFEDVSASTVVQGACTTYGLNSGHVQTTSLQYANAAFTAVGIQPAKILEYPPVDSEEALLYGGKTWMSKDGAAFGLCVDTEAVPGTPMPDQLFWQTSLGTAPASIMVTNNGNMLTDAAAGNYPRPSTYYTGVSTKGAIFTGLNAASQIKATITAFVEIFPRGNDPDVGYATKGAAFDPVALALYTQMMYRLPVAMHASANDFGDWFSKVADLAQEWIPRIQRGITAAIPGSDALVDPIAAEALAAARGAKTVVKAAQKLKGAIDARHAKMQAAKKKDKK